MRPLVSVIVPTYNEEKYIRACLNSVKSQDYPNYEIIIADSKSKDRTVEIAKKYAKIVNAKKGVSAGRNAGAKAAKGDILVFLDADTVLSYNTLTELVKAFHDNVVGATCPILPSHYNMRNLLVYVSFNQFSEYSIRINRPHMAGICMAFRKDAFTKAKGFDEKIKTLEDFDLSLRISKIGKIKFVKDTFVVTSHRRIENWGGLKSVTEYLQNYSKFVLTGKGFGFERYKPIR
ncbi:glycosyltransferase [archaeon]|nr:MAG: glycosyltransferase [archaeon]